MHNIIQQQQYGRYGEYTKYVRHSNVYRVTCVHSFFFFFLLLLMYMVQLQKAGGIAGLELYSPLLPSSWLIKKS